MTDIRAFCGMVLPQFNPRSGASVNKTPDDARKLIGRGALFAAAFFGANLCILGFKPERFPCMKLYHHATRVWWSIFGGQGLWHGWKKQWAKLTGSLR
ncbi:MAG: hypothetical protein ACLQU4_11160 [Limisphaerales bacterium]